MPRRRVATAVEALQSFVDVDPSELESRLQAQGFSRIVGIDEAGRGPLAGPVVSCACILPPPFSLFGLTDSKLLTPSKIAHFYEVLTSFPGVEYAVSVVSREEIDRINILQATFSAMREAAGKLHADVAIVDGTLDPGLSIDSICVTKADRSCLCVSAASVIAKYLRDELMREYDRRFPHYGFARHKGYGTALHRKAIETYGPSVIHRRSFAPVSELIQAREMTAVVQVPVTDLRREPTEMPTVIRGHDRSRETQLLKGSCVHVLSECKEWLEVEVPSQIVGAPFLPYRGWVRADTVVQQPCCCRPCAVDNPLEVARSFLGVPYLWGGFSCLGIDCSGLVSRAYGLPVRNASDQFRVCSEVSFEQLQPGDLIFTSNSSGIDHVLIWTGTSCIEATERAEALVREIDFIERFSMGLQEAFSCENIYFRRLPAQPNFCRIVSK